VRLKDILSLLDGQSYFSKSLHALSRFKAIDLENYPSLLVNQS